MLGCLGCWRARSVQPYMEIVNALEAAGGVVPRPTARERLDDLLRLFSAPVTPTQSHHGGAPPAERDPSAAGMSGVGPDVQEQILRRLEQLDARLARLEMMQIMNTVWPNFFPWPSCARLCQPVLKQAWTGWRRNEMAHSTLIPGEMLSPILTLTSEASLFLDCVSELPCL